MLHEECDMKHVPGVILPCSLNLLSFKTCRAEINLANRTRGGTVSHRTEIVSDCPILLLHEENSVRIRRRGGKEYCRPESRALVMER